jgi:hypothetical protein
VPSNRTAALPLQLRISGEADDALESRDRLQALLHQVQTALLESEGRPGQQPLPAGAKAGGGGQAVSLYWLGTDAPAAMHAAGDAGAAGLPSAEAVAALLGPLEGEQWRAWLLAQRNTRGGRALRGPSVSPGLQAAAAEEEEMELQVQFSDGPWCMHASG